MVEGSGLENRRRATYRGFESHPLRTLYSLRLEGIGEVTERPMVLAC